MNGVLTLTSEVAGGLVLVLGAADEGMEVLVSAARFSFLGGVLLASVLAFALFVGLTQKPPFYYYS